MNKIQELLDSAVKQSFESSEAQDWFLDGEEHPFEKTMFQGSDENQLYPSIVRITPARFGKQLSLVMVNIYFPRFTVCNTAENRIENIIAQYLSEIPEIEYVFISQKNNLFEVWSVINELDREARRNIYDVEYTIIEHFRGMAFDFHIICRNGRNISELQPSKATLIYRK